MPPGFALSFRQPSAASNISSSQMAPTAAPGMTPYDILMAKKKLSLASSDTTQPQAATTNNPTTFNGIKLSTSNKKYVEIGNNNSLIAKNTQSSENQESLILTNQLGNTHGVLVTEDKVIISGGAHSTNMLVDDDGVTFMSSQTGDPVVISGVADGVAAHDAANVGQVQGVVDAAVVPLQGRLDNVESAVQRLDHKINEVEKKLSGGVAMALALSQPVSFAPKAKSAVTGGVATYNGQTAMGFSFNRLLTNTETRRTVVSVGVAATTSGRSSASARIGASCQRRFKTDTDFVVPAI